MKTARQGIFDRSSLFLITLICLFFSAATVMAGSAETAIFNPIKQLAHETGELKPDPGLHCGSLENGFRYILMTNPMPEDRVSMHLFVQAGSMHESEDERGIAHYLEHMLFNGTEHFGPGELVKYFQSIGMRFGPDVNARTGFYSTVYDIDLPQGDGDSLDQGLLVLRDYAAGALIPEAEVEKERSVILAEKRTRDSADYRTFKETLKFELPDALVSQRLPIGTESVIKAADRKLLKSFYDAWYRPERMLLILVGDFVIEEARSRIQSRFADIKARAPGRGYPDAGDISHNGIKSFYHHEPEAGSTTVSIETVRKTPQPADSRKIRRQRVLSRMANQIVNKRLEELSSQSNAPFTSASLHSGIYFHYVQAADLSADCPPEKWAATLQMIEQNLRKALTFGFTENEIEQVKKERLAELERRVKSAATRKSPRLAGHIINSLNRRLVFQSPAQEQALLAPMIEAANKKSLHKALKTDWAPEHRLILVTGNADLSRSVTSPEQQMLKIFNKSRNTQVQAPVEQTAVKFPYLEAPGGKNETAQKKVIEDLGIIQVNYNNNVTLNIKKTDFEANKVSAVLAFSGGGGETEPADKPGLCGLSEAVLNLSGLGGLDRNALKRALAGKNTTVEFKVEEDSFVFTGQSVSDEIPLLFQLLYTHIMDPGYRKEAYEQAMRQFKQKYESWSHSIHGGLLLHGRRFLAGGDSRFGLPDWKTFEKNTLSDVRQWLGPAMAESPVEISVVGDMNVKAVLGAAERWFGSLKGRKPPENPADATRRPSFPCGKSRLIQVPTRIDKGLVVVAYPTDDYWNIYRNRRLSVLSDVMADRMRIRIREKMGAAYSYYVYNHPSRAYPGYGVYHAMVEVAPGDADRVMEAIEAIAEAIAAEGVSEEERDRAVNPALTSIKERIKTNDYWLNNVLNGSSRHPEQIQWSRSFLTDYQSITAEELSKLAKQYLTYKSAARLVIIPANEKDTAPPAKTQEN